LRIGLADDVDMPSQEKKSDASDRGDQASTRQKSPMGLEWLGGKIETYSHVRTRAWAFL
jgi:hypothetical protein